MTTYDITLKIPEGVHVILEGTFVTVKGLKGSICKKFSYPTLVLNIEGDSILIKSILKKSNRSDKMYINTFQAHLHNMFYGVQHGYKATLKVCSGHFPITVGIEGNIVFVKNFLGEKLPRKSTIMDNVNVKVEGDQIIVEGIDIEKVGQTAARIEQSTRITNRDRRVYQDGCYIVKKPGEQRRA